MLVVDDGHTLFKVTFVQCAMFFIYILHFAETKK